MGTPKTLNEAIENGLKEAFGPMKRPRASRIIKNHVKDYMAQKFGISMLAKESLKKCFERITHETTNIDKPNHDRLYDGTMASS